MESNVNKALYKGIKIAGKALIVVLIVCGTIRASLVAYDFGYRVFTEPAMESKPGTTVVVTIEENMEAMDIADYLLEKGLIRDANLFWLQYQLSAYKGELLPGTYSLSTSMTPKEIIVAMAYAGEEEESEASDDSGSAEDTGTSDVAEE